MKRGKTQRVVITLTDDNAGSFKADVTFEPSIKRRTTESPAANAGLNVVRLLITSKAELAIAPKVSDFTRGGAAQRR